MLQIWLNFSCKLNINIVGKLCPRGPVPLPLNAAVKVQSAKLPNSVTHMSFVPDTSPSAAFHYPSYGFILATLALWLCCCDIFTAPAAGSQVALRIWNFFASLLPSACDTQQRTASAAAAAAATGQQQGCHKLKYKLLDSFDNRHGKGATMCYIYLPDRMWKAFETFEILKGLFGVGPPS